VDDAKSKESMLKNFFGTVKGLLRDIPAEKFAAVGQNWSQDEYQLSSDFSGCQAKVHAALCNNFDTPTAMEALFDLVSSANKYINSPARSEHEPRVMLLKSIALFVTRILQVFGLLEDSDGIGYGGDSGGGEAEKYLDAFVLFRDQVRAAARSKGLTELLELCDAVRDGVMVDLGVRVEDRNLADGQGSLWKLDDPQVLRKELEEKRQKQREAAQKKRKNKLQKLEKDLAKWEGVAAVEPEKMFFNDERYGQFDEAGLPTALKNGDPLPKKQQKNAVKEMDKAKAARKQLQEKPGGPEAFLEDLRKEIAALQVE